LVCQVFGISDSKVFKQFSNDYKIYREIFDTGLYGIEIRNISTEPADEIFKIVLDEHEICYKKPNDENVNDIFIPGSINQLKKFAKRVISSGNEDIGYKILGTINNFEDYNKIKYRIGEKDFLFNRAYVMGILNVTPDSFSDGGLFYNIERAVEHGIKMLDEGADFLDIGGESTRPGADPVTNDEEIRRVVPVIENILQIRPDAVISVDTSKSTVAEESVKKGAKIINDISGLTFDPQMLKVIKKHNTAVIIMHLKGTPKDMQQKAEYADVVKDVFDYLRERTITAQKMGIKNIIIDPGIGFAKTTEHNFELLKRLEDFKCLGFPLLTGVSRKSFLGRLLELEVNEREIPTAITETAAVLNGARIIRTHNVKYGRYVSTITEKFLRYV
jgi:dihydropteroate synthase